MTELGIPPIVLLPWDKSRKTKIEKILVAEQATASVVVVAINKDFLHYLHQGVEKAMDYVCANKCVVMLIYNTQFHDTNTEEKERWKRLLKHRMVIRVRGTSRDRQIISAVRRLKKYSLISP